MTLAQISVGFPTAGRRIRLFSLPVGAQQDSSSDRMLLAVKRRIRETDR